jgi:hypothetical protein
MKYATYPNGTFIYYYNDSTQTFSKIIPHTNGIIIPDYILFLILLTILSALVTAYLLTKHP